MAWTRIERLRGGRLEQGESAGTQAGAAEVYSNHIPALQVQRSPLPGKITQTE
jgi:hypothetical protein